MTNFQKQIIKAIKMNRNSVASLDDIAWRLKSNRLAVHSALRSLESTKIIGRSRSGVDRWAVLRFFIIDKETAQKVIAELEVKDA